ncbi:hypothetical protein E4H12_11360 [Candidatus Thorarchaeota archaeon]|nr:MAG: hypothetical protein E4H12_11360 [Candidatus Thorarchaeota archaeon]
MSTVSLTSNQKRVLAKIVASPTPTVAGEEISGDQNLIAARDQLVKLGAVEFVGSEASMTDNGQQIARDANIVDEAGQLTPDGEALAYTDSQGHEDKDTARQPETSPPQGAPGASLPGPATGSGATPSGGVDAGMNLAMSHVPQYGQLELLQELLTPKDPKAKVKKPRKPSTLEQREKSRARHWSKTGVSDETIKWMKDGGML